MKPFFNISLVEVKGSIILKNSTCMTTFFGHCSVLSPKTNFGFIEFWHGCPQHCCLFLECYCELHASC